MSTPIPPEPGSYSTTPVKVTAVPLVIAAAMTDEPDPYATTAAEATAVLLGIAAVITAAWAISARWPVWLTLLVVFVCCPLAGLGMYAALGRIGRGRRLRIRYQPSPRPAVVLTDTPRPGCSDCEGAGGWIEHYGDGSGEYGGETAVYCDCWTSWARVLLPVPRRLARLLVRLSDRRDARRGFGYSDEPPF